MRVLMPLLALCAWPGLVVAKTPPPAVVSPPAASTRFQPIGSHRPFPAEIITEVMLDRTGFLWIGTREGLVLYDGQHFRKFQHEVQNPESLSSNGVRGIFEDDQGRLWVNTISGGLDLLDRTTWTFRSWRHQRNDPTSISHDGVFALAQARDGKLWVGTQAGLDLFDPATGTFAHQVLATGGEFIMALMLDREGRLWVATLGQGLFRQRADRSGFESVRGSPGNSPLDIFALAQAGDGDVWVGARNGLYRVRVGAEAMGKVNLSPTAVAKQLLVVTALVPTADGGLWIGTFGHGLFRLPAGTQTLRRVAVGADSTGAGDIDAGALALDRSGQLLVGTFGAGLFKASQDIAGLRTWSETQAEHPGLSNQDVYAVLAQPADATHAAQLLVGSFGGGLDRIALDSGTVTHLPLPVDPARQQHLSGVIDLLRTPQGTLWAATNEGVYRWNQESGAFKYYQPGRASAQDSVPGYSYALFRDRDGRLWVGSAGGGVFLYQPGDDGFRHFRPQRGDPHSLSDDFVTAMLEDRFGRLWVGTRSGGISICRLQASLRCDHLGSKGGAHVLSHDHVTSLLASADGAIWAGTEGGGFDRVVLDSQGAVTRIDYWTRNDGLVDNNVMALVQNADGALWLSTHGGLSRFDPKTGRFDNLTGADGLPTAVFNPKAAVWLDQRLYFGSAKGVVALDPAAQIRRSRAPPTVIEALYGLDSTQRIKQPAWQLNHLDVAWRTPFSLQFAVLGYDGGAPQFEYRLAADDAWTDLGDRGRLTLHALAPGHHLLEVRGRRGGYGWTRAQPLALDIVPPWWRRAEVQTTAAVLAFLLLVGGFYWRVRELQARNGELERVHGLREQALAQAHANRDELHQALATLRHMTMRLEAAKEKERKHLARELHDEFGQALTSAKINLGLALRRLPSAEGKARVTDTVGLIQRMIDQVRALSLNLRPPLLDEMGLIPALEAYLHAVSERSGLPIETQLDNAVSLASTEHEMAVFRIVQEAVTNVLRHAHTSALEVSVTTVDGGIEVRVRDDGAGFDAGELQVKPGSGMGLFGMRERVHDLGGHLALDSARGRGTVVNVFIPETRTDA